MNFVMYKRLHLSVDYISWECKIEIPFCHPLKQIPTVVAPCSVQNGMPCVALKIITVILMFFVTIVTMLV